jgi:hypothetical protein
MLVEAMLSMASGSGAIAGIEVVSGSLAYLTRGTGLPHGASFDLTNSLTTRRPFQLM